MSGWLRARTLTGAFLALASVLVVAVLATEPFVYILGGRRVANTEITPRVVAIGVPGSNGPAGGLITADLDGNGRRDFVVTGPGRIGAVTASGARLWSKEIDIQVTGQAESEGLPGLHAPGVQAADIDGDRATEVLFLTRGGALAVLDGASGVERALVRLPAPPQGAERWEHLVVADFRGKGERDLLLQATNAAGYRMGRFLAAYALDELLHPSGGAWRASRRSSRSIGPASASRWPLRRSATRRATSRCSSR